MEVPSKCASKNGWYFASIVEYRLSIAIVYKARNREKITRDKMIKHINKGNELNTWEYLHNVPVIMVGKTLFKSSRSICNKLSKLYSKCRVFVRHERKRVGVLRR